MKTAIVIERADGKPNAKVHYGGKVYNLPAQLLAYFVINKVTKEIIFENITMEELREANKR